MVVVGVGGRERGLGGGGHVRRPGELLLLWDGRGG